jgi:23S rRNA (cytidine1920-2'-O)/16S rRNA (cytidine1409-2'-O)-methyltransferase
MARQKTRLDELLVVQGLLPDLKTARGWIGAGKVVVDGKVVATAGSAFAPNADVRLRGQPLRYASRGGYKLEGAIARFGVDVAGKTCVDAGASAGGFTDCLLQRGAARVHAVDVGYGLLKGRLAADARVQVYEKTNISDLPRAAFDPPLDLAVVDLSYLTLQVALPILRALFDRPYDIVALIKPSFEGLGDRSPSDPAHLRDLLAALFERLAPAGFRPERTCVSPLLGSHSAIEFLARFRHAAPGLAPGAAADAALLDLQDHPPSETPRS